ncbi:lipocalin-like domain-containing protein [Spirosoma radiotolerans]|uniref:Lipocalin-like domain-containing protein n=1 Tax=Spirosoma radiotolerans TaxID=1379870 RepID=A0A0E3ZZI8_9BACT|nr:lipocalin family protein [Spirosoma radiotolerans]AKD57693.1 hypothetical protein SD10_25180 [Spirosoma radiotolerans]
MKHVVLLLSLLLVLACSKSDDTVSPNNLIGTWRLITYCKPASSSTCMTVDVPSNKGVFITFNYAGEFNEFYENTKPVEYSFLGCFGGNYKTEGNNIRIMAACMSSMNGKLIPLLSLTGNRLVLNPYSTGEYVFIRR